VEGSVIKRKINFLLLAIPLVMFRSPIIDFVLARLGLAEHEGAKHAVEQALPFILFALAAVALIPLAGFVESAVEELAELLGPFVGGLLHTTFGNVAELTIGLSVLLSFAGDGGADIVRGSIAGVIIRNSLLFLGLSTLLGAARNGRMKFDAENASEYSTIFALAVIGLSLPTIASVLPRAAGAPALHLVVLGLPLSAVLAIVLLVSYLAYVGFAVFRMGEGYNLVEQRQKRKAARRAKRQQRRHKGDAVFAPLLAQTDTQALFEEERESAEKRERIYATAGLLEHKRRKREAQGRKKLFHNQPILRGIAALLVLAVATAGVAAMSENFAGSVEEIIKQVPVLKQYEFFLGLILIPLLAGVVELYGSVGAARENRMEITMAVTAGATIQMILLVVPVLVLVGLNTGHPLDLFFKPIEIIVFGAATFIFMLLSRDGESTWLEGSQLCTLWLLVAITAAFVTG
jgi:Ca2+:H+ antiporter